MRHLPYFTDRLLPRRQQNIYNHHVGVINGVAAFCGITSHFDPSITFDGAFVNSNDKCHSCNFFTSLSVITHTTSRILLSMGFHPGFNSFRAIDWAPMIPTLTVDHWASRHHQRNHLQPDFSCALPPLCGVSISLSKIASTNWPKARK